MRNLDSAENRCRIKDGMSGDVHEITYRAPTNAEIAAYHAKSFERKGKRVVSRLTDVRLEHGKKIITGFKKGTFGIGGAAFASDPDDPDYRSDWKDLLADSAPDIVALVGLQAFEGTTLLATEEDEDGGEEEEKDGPPS